MTIAEFGLYKLVLRSDKPQAKPFQDWVTRVVLPAIREDGGYIMGEEKVARTLFETAFKSIKALGVAKPVNNNEWAKLSTLGAASFKVVSSCADRRF